MRDIVKRQERLIKTIRGEYFALTDRTLEGIPLYNTYFYSMTRETVQNVLKSRTSIVCHIDTIYKPSGKVSTHNTFDGKLIRNKNRSRDRFRVGCKIFGVVATRNIKAWAKKLG